MTAIRMGKTRARPQRAKRHGHSIEAEARSILNEVAKPAKKVGVGSALAALAKPLGGFDLKISRDKIPALPPNLS